MQNTGYVLHTRRVHQDELRSVACAVGHVGEDEAAGDAGISLHRGEIRGPVLVADRQPRDEMVEDELVQHDDAGAPAQSLDDPAVRLGIVADVVQRDVGGHRSRPAAAHDVDLDEARERGQQQRGVIGNARPLRRKRRVVRDPHAT